MKCNCIAPYLLLIHSRSHIALGTRETFILSAFDEFLREEAALGSDVASDEAIAAYIRQMVNTYWHPVGRCKMDNDSLAVIDAQLRVHAIEGLCVVDASVMPTILSGTRTHQQS